MRSVVAAAALFMLAACASGPPPPDWQMNARSAMERYLDAYFGGEVRIEAQELQRVRAEIARTGRPELLARAELLRCAAQVASLDFDECPAYQALEPDAAAPERAYADYLSARIAPANVALLPEPQRALAATAGAGPGDAAALLKIEDPLSRLVAAGVLLRGARAHPAVFGVAIDTASAQGWRRPLMAWLKLALQRAEQAGDSADAQRLRRRIALVEGGGTAPK
ncbi:hypothetical protein HLB44_15320 [Aquincola sp. S2]|uniref:Lipoprotein n=1 Tax=Pseudaquabacterium terrae TaxID=2732868 RepID=A0ABX2EIC4_9BURK|nr:hypothetical protein [Aquabacterium terrae]NRF68363.1 hypothetical protein [Aquabacterium terrae]